MLDEHTRRPLPSERRITLVARRPTPLSAGEHRLLAELANAAHDRLWRHLRVPELVALDGPDDAVGWLATQVIEPDPACIEWSAFVQLAERFRRALPGATLALHDPTALLCLQGDRLVLFTGESDQAELLALDTAWSPPLEHVLLPPADCPLPDPPPTAPAPRTEGELSDLLQAIARMGPQRELLRAGAGPGVVQLDRLCSLVRSAVLPGAACVLLADLSRRALVDVGDLETAVDHILQQGDADEREAAACLLADLRNTSATDITASWNRRGAAGTWTALEQLGATLLAHQALGEADPETLEWEDDLLGDDLVLLDPDAEVPENPVAQALRSVLDAPALQACPSLATEATFVRQARAWLRGSDAQVAGLCLALHAGAWPCRAIPGLQAALAEIMGSTRPAAVRALAAVALTATGREDAAPALIAQLSADDVQVARAALRGLGALPGADARRAVRTALANDALAAQAVAAAAAAGDPGAFRLAVSLADHDDPDVRQSVARHLDAIGGRRAAGALRTLHRNDPSWVVRLEAAGSLTRLTPLDELGELLESADADALARILRALGEADRADAFALLERSARHVRSAVREAAAAAMGQLGLPAATPALVGMLQDANPDVRIAAIDALATCGDRRALHPLRRQAGRDDDTGAAAQRVLRCGRRLRLPPPDSRIAIRAVSEAPLSPAEVETIRTRLSAAGLGASVGAHVVECTTSIDPGSLSALSDLAATIDHLHRAVPALRWSVRDGQYALRLVGEGWAVSGRRGIICRDAGWFDEALPASSERPPLVPIRGPVASSVAPLPVAVMQHVKGREQVRVAVDPDRAADPDEVTGDVPSPVAGGPQVDDGGQENLSEAATEGNTRASSARPLPRHSPVNWDDLLSEQRADAALERLARQGLTDFEREQVRTWLGSGLPGIQIAACRVVLATHETSALGAVAALRDHSDPEVRLAVAAALAGGVGAGDPATLEALEALSSDDDPEVRAQALAAGAAQGRGTSDQGEA